MTGEQVFVSHAPADLDTVQELFPSIRNMPFGVYIAMEEVEPGRSRHNLEGRIRNSDVLVAVLTERAATNQWVNQEIGYAIAKGIPVVPLYEDTSDRGGYVDRVEGVAIDHENPQATIFNLLSRLRAELAPLGALSVPDWFVRFPCNFDGCGERVTLDLDGSQKNLWRKHEHKELLRTECSKCSSTYLFEPATLAFVRREDGSIA
jgi:hypothetical protein